MTRFLYAYLTGAALAMLPVFFILVTTLRLLAHADPAEDPPPVWAVYVLATLTVAFWPVFLPLALVSSRRGRGE